MFKWLFRLLGFNKIKVKVKLLDPNATIPTKSRPDDAAWDLYALEDTALKLGEPTVIKTGVAFQFPQYYHGMIWDRSSMGAKGLHVLGGLIDQPYTGEIKIVLIDLNFQRAGTYQIKAGDKIAQMVISKIPYCNLHLVSDLSSTSRGDKGFGSSGV